MKILIKFPTRGRPEKFFSTFNLYHNMCSDIENIIFLVSIDEDDESMNNINVLNFLSNFRNTVVIKGSSKSKIDAVNRDIEKIVDSWDILLLASDDMIPQIIGYDNIIRDNMSFNYPDNDGILWFNDGFQGNRLNTLCILGKKYYERFNYIYHPDYKSCWSDNEFMMVGNILKKQSYIDQVIIKHEHPDWGYGSADFVHHKNVEDWGHDHYTYQIRSSNNFYL